MNTETISPAKKPTMATVKSFINKNRERLLIDVRNSFDGMYDCCMPLHEGFTPAKKDKTNSVNSDYHQRTHGILGAWFVGDSRDYITSYETDKLIGFDISNSCGHFILAIEKN